MTLIIQIDIGEDGIPEPIQAASALADMSAELEESGFPYQLQGIPGPDGTTVGTWQVRR